MNHTGKHRTTHLFNDVCPECGQPHEGVSVVSYGNVVLNKGDLSATINGKRTQLTPAKFNILWKLVAKKGHIAPGWWLRQTDADDEISDGCLKTHLSQLRLQISPLTIRNIHSQGYRIG